MNLCACQGCLEFATVPSYDTAGYRRGFICTRHALEHLSGQPLADGEGTPIAEIGYRPGRRTWIERMRASKRVAKDWSAQAAIEAREAEKEPWIEHMRAVRRVAKRI